MRRVESLRLPSNVPASSPSIAGEFRIHSVIVMAGNMVSNREWWFKKVSITTGWWFWTCIFSRSIWDGVLLTTYFLDGVIYNHQPNCCESSSCWQLYLWRTRHFRCKKCGKHRKDIKHASPSRTSSCLPQWLPILWEPAYLITQYYYVTW